MFANSFNDKKVLVTGHTGFKGSWLCEWLLQLGAEVTGYALDPLNSGDLYNELELSSRIATDVRADLSDRDGLVSLISELKPDFVFHLAAQPLVRLSYSTPVETFQTNVLGSIHLLDALRISKHECACVMVTTDKCYQNREWLSSYREEDAMGGHDPYSASKGAAEIAISSYRSSFFSEDSSPVKVASGRAGNVLGGGDWAEDRIVPDCIRSIQQGEAITVRNKTATRPWQHVLEPLSGYLWLGAVLANPTLAGYSDSRSFTGGFNFGPALSSNRTVAELVEEILKHIDGKWIDAADSNALHEASKLNLAIDKAFHLLQWSPVWDFKETMKTTAAWYHEVKSSQDAQQHTRADIERYTNKASQDGILWAQNS
ncbi:MAG: CDP-glucose 4,6-dehydratase [Roseibacillus sp.]